MTKNSTIPSLRDLQKWMKWRLTPTEGPEPQPICAHAIAEDSLSREARLDIYANGYLARIVENLQADYTAVARSLGEDRFWDLVKEYISQFPSTSPTVNDLGRSFPAFVLLSDISSEFPYLFELATFEWGLCEALYSGTEKRADLAKLQGVPDAIWSQARIILNPSIRLFRFQWPIDRLWRESTSVKKEISEEETFILVHGYGEKSYFQKLTGSEFKALRLLQKGSTLEVAISDSGLTDPAQINAAFSKWMSWGIFTDFDLSTEGCD